MDDIIADPRIYGGAAPSNTPVPVILPPTQAAPQTVEPPAMVSAATGAAKSLPSAVSGAAQQTARAVEPKATVWESVSGAISQTSPFKVWQWANEPSFEPSAEFQLHPNMRALPFVPTKEQEEYLGAAKSQAQFDYRKSQLEDQTLVEQAMGAHPWLSMAVSVADLGYLAIGGASLKAASLARTMGASVGAARGVAAGVEVAGALGIGYAEKQVSAISDTEIALNAIAVGVAGLLSYRPRFNAAGDNIGGEFVPKDPAWPGKQLGAVAEDLARTVPDDTIRGVRAEAADLGAVKSPTKAPLHMSFFTEKGAPTYEATARSAKQVLSNLSAAGGEFAELSRLFIQYGGKMLDDLPVKQIRDTSERAYYHAGEHAIYADLSGAVIRSDVNRVLVHEIAHGLTVQRLHYGIENPNTHIGSLTRQLMALRMEAADIAYKNNTFDEIGKYLVKDVYEFTAGLFWGGSPFTYGLAAMKTSSGTNMLSKMVGVVRKMMGLTSDKESILTKALGITEELMQQPLEIAFGGRKSVYFAPKPTGDVAEQIVKNEEAWSKKTGNTIAWNLHKTMASFGEEWKKISDTLFDDPVNMSGDSVASQARAIRADFSALQYKFEDTLKEVLASRKAGVMARLNPRSGAGATQEALESELKLEMLARERGSIMGVKPPVNPDPDITRLADALEPVYTAALKEQQRSGVLGAADVVDRPGYFPRRWGVAAIEGTEKKLLDSGMSPKQAKTAVTKMVARGMRRANPTWDDELATDIAGAILSRAKAKGYLEDSAFRRHIGNEAAKEVREILSQSGISNERLQRAMDAITGAVDEAGKLPTMKHRIDIDMRYGITVPGTGEVIRVADLVEGNIMRLTEGYLDKAASAAAFARKGLVTATDVDNLRTTGLKSLKTDAERKEAAYLFDNGVAALRGDPVGEPIGAAFRKLQAVTQMVGLSSSGMWQITETANILANFGMVRTVKEMIRTMPGFEQLLGSVQKDAGEATRLNNILMRNSSQDTRLRPYLEKLEDNFDMPIGDAVAMSLTQAKQLVPYINGMKYVQHWQARLVGNLVTDTFERAAKGDKLSLEALNKYGLESRTMDAIRNDIVAHGLDTAKWADSTWEQVRGPLTKMMDDSVLRARTGEIPAFAQFSQVGKFVFTFRSFVLAAHNKVLAGTLGREGFAGLGLLMAYQYPLTFLATAANHGMANKKQDKTVEQLAAASLGQMGAMGLFSEFFGVITGNKQQFGAPGLIPIDRMYKAGASLASGNPGDAAAAFLNVVPILSIIPGTKALSETLKE